MPTIVEHTLLSNSRNKQFLINSFLQPPCRCKSRRRNCNRSTLPILVWKNAVKLKGNECTTHLNEQPYQQKSFQDLNLLISDRNQFFPNKINSFQNISSVNRSPVRIWNHLFLIDRNNIPEQDIIIQILSQQNIFLPNKWIFSSIKILLGFRQITFF